MNKRDEDKTLSDFLRMNGFSFELTRALARAVERRGGTMADLRRIISDASTANQVIDVLMRNQLNRSTSVDMPTPDPYIIRVNRGGIPTGDQFYRDFPGEHMRPKMFDSAARWEKHPYRFDLGGGDLDDETVEALVRPFSAKEVAEMGGASQLWNDKTSSWGRADGWLPANIEEGYALGTNLDAKELLGPVTIKIAIPGASFVSNNTRYIAVLSGNERGWAWHNVSPVKPWRDHCYHLFVRRVRRPTTVG